MWGRGVFLWSPLFWAMNPNFTLNPYFVVF